MKALLLAAVAGAALAASVQAALDSSTFFSPPRELDQYGRVLAVTRVGGQYEVRVDPALFLSGRTANRAAVADRVIPPGDVVPNDHYVRDESHAQLVYFASPGAHVTVLTHVGEIRSTTIPIAELGAIVAGRNPRHRRLFSPKNGFWIRVRGDRAIALDQQYRP